MLDFTSALYLGLAHGGRSLAPWRELTTGVPAVLREAPETAAVARRLAGLQGCEAATLAPSTLHALCDLLGQLGAERRPIYVDAGTYAIGRIAADFAAARGAPVTMFPRHDPAALRRCLGWMPTRPVVIADGYTPGVGPTPVGAYLDSRQPPPPRRSARARRHASARSPRRPRRRLAAPPSTRLRERRACLLAGQGVRGSTRCTLRP